MPIMKVTKHQTGPFLKLNMIIQTQDNNSCLSEVFNIDNLITVRIKFISNSFSYTSGIIVQKHNLAKESTVKVKVSCPNPSYFKEWICTADDETLYTIGELKCELKCGNLSTFLLEVSVYVTKIEHISAKLYEDCEFTDFKLTTDEGSVDVHKAYLAVHSDVFKAMLSGDWKETASGQVNTKDVSLQTLRDLKQYMYLGTLPDNNLQLQPLLLLSMFYLMESLKMQCVMKLALSVKSKDLYSLLGFAFENNISELTFAILISMSDRDVQGAQELMTKKNKDSCVQTGPDLEVWRPRGSKGVEAPWPQIIFQIKGQSVAKGARF